MALQSMTGFARSQGNNEQGSWVWEMRSVNNKGLDVRLRLPHGFEALEVRARKRFAEFFTRGSLQASLQFSGDSASSVPVINEEVLDAVVSAAEAIHERIGGDKPSAQGLLAIKGVLEIRDVELTDTERGERDEAVWESFETALQQLKAARAGEGTSIATVIADQVSQIEQLVRQLIDNPERSPEAIASRLKQQLETLTSTEAGLDLQRVHQEAAILATKADLQEELDRLQAHVGAANELLQSDGPVGRKLDFLAQEFNRECNTICSKSNATSVTNIGLNLKIVVDQLREQTQNLE